MTEYRVLWTDAARHDLENIADYIAGEDGIPIALDVVRRLESRAAELFTLPERGTVVPELLDIGIPQYRQLTVKPWRVFYRIEGDAVHVMAVVDSRRDIVAFLMERLFRV